MVISEIAVVLVLLYNDGLIWKRTLPNFFTGKDSQNFIWAPQITTQHSQTT